MNSKEFNQTFLKWTEAGRQSCDNDFALFVRVMRKHRGYSRQQLAQLSGICTEKLILVENGMQLLDEYEKRGIENLLKLTYAEFVARMKRVIEHCDGTLQCSFN